MKRVILLLVLILLICSGFAFAAVPCKINYQGRLIENNVPVDNTAGIPMIFKLFNTATGTEGEKVVYSGDVPVYNGLFRVVLDLQGIDWTAGEAKYLQVIVDEEPLSPREELSAYPYAINSHLLEGATKEYFLNTSGDTQTKQGNLNIMGNVGIGTTGPQAKLEIKGTQSTTPGTNLDMLFGTTGALGFRSADTGGYDHLYLDRYYGDTWQSTPVMTWRTDGNVGIGTTNPGEKLEVVGKIKVSDGIEPTYDSGWFSIAQFGQTYKKQIGFTGLPKFIMAYYKRSNGQIFPWGLNQYGDANQGNGVLLDFDGNGNLYVRLPSGNSAGNNVLHIGFYRNRANDGDEKINNETNVQFRVLLWK